MYIDNKLWIAKGERDIYLYPSMANRHGLIAGATGTGKTTTLKVIVESFSDLGVPVFLADIKGDLCSLCKVGEETPKLKERLDNLQINNFNYKSFPVELWDVFKEKGIPVRTTISEMGPLLLSKLLGLNDTQRGVLQIIFKIADNEGMLLLDMKDLRSLLKYASDNASEYTTTYGNITKQSIGAIQRSLLVLEEQGGEMFFGEPGLDLHDFIRTNSNGKGYINILDSSKLYNSQGLYSTFLLWMLSELFEILPEVGDVKIPKLVFFFDEAHLLFKDTPKILIDKIEQVVRLIRSKGVGVYFITQSPLDIPESVLAQLGNRIQHALRAYTPTELKNVKYVANTFRENPLFKTQDVITELGTGEALISFLNESGIPEIVERAFILPPQSFLGTISPEDYKNIITNSPFISKYKETIDRESAYEILNKKVESAILEKQVEAELKEKEKAEKEVEKEKLKQEKEAEKERLRQEKEAEKERIRLEKEKAKAKSKPNIFEKAANSAVQTMGRELGKQAINTVKRSILDTLFKGK